MANGSSDERVTWWRKLTLEDIVITSFVLVGLIGGLLICILWRNAYPIIIAIFFGVGIASLVYRFLGGISQTTSITIIGCKLTGTFGVLLFSIYFIDGKLVEQRQWTPKENLTLSFYRGNDLIKEHIKVETDKPIPIKNGKFILSFKNLEETEGRFFINYEPPVETGETNSKNIYVTYHPGTPKINLNLDFFDKKDRKYLTTQNVTLTFRTFRTGFTDIRGSGFTIKNEKDEEIPEKEGEFTLPFNLFRDGYINIERKRTEEKKLQPIQIQALQYKFDPPRIIIYLEK
jgi:hypothetical protein